jgi:hypothetical protein
VPDRAADQLRRQHLLGELLGGAQPGRIVHHRPEHGVRLQPQFAPARNDLLLAERQHPAGDLLLAGPVGADLLLHPRQGALGVAQQRLGIGDQAPIIRGHQMQIGRGLVGELAAQGALPVLFDQRRHVEVPVDQPQADRGPPGADLAAPHLRHRGMDHLPAHRQAHRQPLADPLGPILPLLRPAMVEHAQAADRKVLQDQRMPADGDVRDALLEHILRREPFRPVVN